MSIRIGKTKSFVRQTRKVRGVIHLGVRAKCGPTDANLVPTQVIDHHRDDVGLAIQAIQVCRFENRVLVPDQVPLLLFC